MAQKVRWGVLGCGNIAKKFAAAVEDAEGAELFSAGSRSLERAEAFADQFNIPRRYGSYEDLAADEDVDAIYVATPHPYHMDCCILAMNDGKAVLCEKPFALNAGQAAKMVAVARANQVFLMEAMWSRFLPSVKKAKALISSGAIGELRMVHADLGFRADLNPASRLFDPALGGGALLDVGVYPVSLASHFIGSQPDRISSDAHLGTTGVDEQSAMIFHYPNGLLAVLTSAVRTQTRHEASFYGTEGMLILEFAWWSGSSITLKVAGKETERIEVPMTGNGFNYEIAEASRCIADGRLESDIIRHEESVAIMGTLDTIREQWGLAYPKEKQ